MDMAMENNLKKKELSVTEMVPPEYHKFLDVFDEKKANWFLESQPWDHKIEMKECFEPKITILHWKNKLNWIPSWRKIWKKAIFIPHNLC